MTGVASTKLEFSGEARFQIFTEKQETISRRANL